MRHYWKWRQALHSMLGVITLIFTIAGALIILKYVGWTFYFTTWHNVAGTVFMGLCSLLCIGGIFVLTIKRYCDYEWATKSMLRISSLHKYLGYFVILTVQVAVCTGITRIILLGDKSKQTWVALVAGNLAFFFGALAIGEYYYQKRQATQILFKSLLEIQVGMSRSQFDTLVARGEQLVILDNLVLNVKEFINVHPGGKFVMRHTIGTDISKYFFGGYSLEGNLAGVA